jgi:aspartyl-tRNA(Asn)/glutamyl-tRNA(Gln) amidotransferase subunit C
MAFSQESLARLAKLSRLALPESQLADLGSEMSSILALIDRLQAVDTAGATPLAHPLWVQQEIEDAMHLRALRADTPEAAIDRDANLRNAPQTENGLFLVPKVIE